MANIMLQDVDVPFSDKDQLFMLKDFLTRGMRQSEIAKTLNVSRQRVQQLFKKHGLEALPEHRKLPTKDRKAFLKVYLTDFKDSWLWNTIKAKCIPRNIFYDLKGKVPDVCPILGTPLVYTRKRRFINSYLNIPSLDKVFPERGYVKGNVRVISLKANMLKNDATVEQLENIIKYMKGDI